MTFDATPTMPIPAGEPYPLRLTIGRPSQQSRLLNFPLGIGLLIRTVLLIPHFAILILLGIAAAIVVLVATIAILFTGRYPAGLFTFYVGVSRWGANVYGYLFHLYDAYPPFSMDQQVYDLEFAVDYPEKLNRLLNLPYIGSQYVKPILCIPHFVCLFFLFIVAMVVLIVAPFAILFTGSYPEGMHTFSVGVGRWLARVNAYIYALTDKYPPFSLS